MTRYVALLRGIGPTNPNMRSHKLQQFFVELGFTNVQTLITSGNVIFDSANDNVKALETLIEDSLPVKLGFTSTTIIRSQSYLKKLLDQDPYAGQIHNKKSYLLITFFKDKLSLPFKLPHQPASKPYSVIGGGEDVIFGVVDLSQGKTPDYMVWLEKQFGKQLTSRTLKTIERIVAKMDQI